MFDQSSYPIQNGCICIVVKSNKGEENRYIPLCNFTAIITKEITRDDGNIKSHSLIIEGVSKDGEIFETIEIPSENFASLSWITKWGPKAIIYSGYSFREHIRVAIQEYSIEHKKITKHICTGWANIDGTNYYLSASGAISSNGLNKDILVDLDEVQLQNYTLPAPPTPGPELIEAIKGSLSLLNGDVPDHISIPLFASLYRASIGDIKEINFTVMLVGKTGAMKTSYAGLVLGHFGNYNELNVPESWVSTANSLERKAYLIKDAPFLVDEYHPKETDLRVVEHLIRGQGNGVGRSRMRANGTLRTTNIPRCLLISTGEDVPPGHSLRSRMLIVEVKPGDISTEAINTIKENQQHFSKAMSGFIVWLAGKYNEKKATTPKRFEFLRKRFIDSKSHLRVSSTIADLLVGLEEFLEFAEESEAITQDERAEIVESRAIPTFRYLQEFQRQYHEIADPVDTFITNIRSALTTGKAHLKGKGNRIPSTPEKWGWKTDRDGNWVTSGDHIGWITENEIWFQPEAAFNIANRLASCSSQRIHINRDTLWSRMADKGLLTISHGEMKNTIKRQVDPNKRPRVIVINDISLFQSFIDEMQDDYAPCAPENPTAYESLLHKANIYSSGTYVSPHILKTH